MKPPAFQFYADDFLGGTMHFTDAEVGLYVRLLCVQWSTGSVPNDDSELSSYGRGDTSLTRVKSKFILGADGRLRNERMEQERAKQIAFREKQAVNGSMGGRPLKPKPNPDLSQAVTQTEPKKSSPSPVSVSGFLSPDSVSSKAVGRAVALPDAEWIKSLVADPAYQGVPVEVEVAKCSRWCETNRKAFNRKRVVNWLNRFERPLAPINGNSGVNPHHRRAATAEEHAKGFFADMPELHKSE